ncbi:MAG TPA: AAA family ATPase [Actinocrinis sp.]|nr:AAA family ATPase [Actinocrinis sp.]
MRLPLAPKPERPEPAEPEELWAARADLCRTVREQLRDGPGVLLYGPAGIGRSALLDGLARGAQSHGIRILRCAPAESERGLPFAGLIDLLSGLADEAFAGLPEGLGAALRSAVLLGVPSDGGQDDLRVRMAVLHLLRVLAERSPVWLLVDDAQWLDRPTGEVLAFVARRCAGSAVRILAAEQVRGTGAPAFAAAPGITLARIEVPMPSPADLGALLTSRCDRELPAATVDLIHRSCGGNLSHAVELARSLPPSCATLSADGSLPVPARLRESLLRVPRGLPAPTRALLLVASAARRPTLALLAEACADGRAAAHLAAAEQAGVVRVDPAGPVEFCHPLVRAAIYADAAAGERGAVHAGLAGAVTETAERARHLALADPRRAEPLARQLAEAAAAAGRRGAPRQAVELADLAAQRTPGDAAYAHTRAERLLAAARHACDAGLLGDARRFANQVLEGGASAAQRTAARIFLLRCAGQALGAAAPLIAQGLAESGGRPALEARLWSWSAAAELTAGNAKDSLRHARKAADFARRAGDPIAEIGALSKLAHVHALTGDAEGEPVLRRALELVEREVVRGAAPRTAFWEPLRRQAVFDLQAGRLGEAEQRLADLAGRLGETFDHEGLLTVLVTLTDVRVRAGRCRAALESAGTALRVARELGPLPAPVLFAAALAESAGGTLAEALRYAEDAVSTARADGDMHGLLRALGALGGALLQSGAADRAVVVLREADLIERRVGIVDPASGNWHTSYGEALVAAGRLQEAAAVLDRVGARARELGRAQVTAALDRGRAVLDAALGRPDDAARALRRVADLQAEQAIEQVRTLLQLAAVERQRGRAEQVRSALTEARRVAGSAGAAPWIARVDGELGREDADRAPASGIVSGYEPYGSRTPHESRETHGPRGLQGLREPYEPRGTRESHVPHEPRPNRRPAHDPAPRPEPAPGPELTPAEERCARLAARGATNREIAAALHLSVKTVEGTLSRTYRKLGVRSRTQLAQLARPLGPGETGRGPTEYVPGFS